MKNYFQNLFNKISNMKSSGSMLNFKDLLHNRFILYFFLLISLVDLFYFANIRDTTSIAVFILVGFLTAFFSKNMIIIMVIALCATHLIKFGIKNVINEGMEEEGFDGDEGFDEGLDGDEGFDEGLEGEEGFEGFDEEGMEDEGFDEGLEGEEGFEGFDEEGMEDEGFDEGLEGEEGFEGLEGEEGMEDEGFEGLENEKEKDYEQFKVLQNEILGGMQKLEPLISKAESFVEKYEEKYGLNE